MLGKCFLQILNMSFTAGVMIIAVLLVRLALRKAPKIFSYCLWAVVLFRLLCPVSFSAPVSLLGTLGASGTERGSMTYISESFLAAPESLETVVYNGGEGTIQPGQQSLGAASGLAQLSGVEQPSLSTAMRAGMFLWLAGILGFAVYSVVSISRLKVRLRYAREEIGTGNIGVFRTDKVQMPFVIGLIRPNIYLPEQMEWYEQSYILIHERIHIRRGDHIWRLLAFMALCLHWFNPLVWAAFFLSERDMEMSCDEAVLRKFGNQIKKDYSTSLLAMAAGRKISHRISPAFAEGSTESRIHNVLKYKKPTVLLIGAAVVVSVVAAVFLLGNPANASEEPEAYVHHAIVTEVTEWQNQKDGSTVVSLLLSSGRTVTISEDTAVEPYFEFDMSQGIKAGDLVRITFPKGEEVLVLETYPERFSKSPELIEVMGRGFSIERVDSAQHLYKFAVPLGMAREACPGDQLEIWHYPDVDLYLDPYIGQQQEPVLFASVPVLEVDESKFDVWVQLSEEQVDIFMQEFGFGVFCTVIKSGDGQGSDPEKDGVFVEDVPLQTLSAEILRSGRIPDGEYLVQVYSLSEYERVIDRYRVDDWDSGEELPKLTFSTVCYHWVCEEAGSGNYVARDLQDFVLETQEELEKGDVSLRLEFKEGLIVSAYMSRAAEQ